MLRILFGFAASPPAARLPRLETVSLTLGSPDASHPLRLRRFASGGQAAAPGDGQPNAGLYQMLRILSGFAGFR